MPHITNASTIAETVSKIASRLLLSPGAALVAASCAIAGNIAHSNNEVLNSFFFMDVKRFIAFVYKVELVISSESSGMFDKRSTLSFFIFFTSTSSTIKNRKKMMREIMGYILASCIFSAYCFMNLNMAINF
ncbi:MAG: hypothetical protein BGP13_18950 [Sphingobacteriales bacterium 40-81]|nr:MAG: hypothetical protein BGP13_18950 [Sphingobacteriales bacterium 40-81]